jgi:hypothetical protein
VTIRDTINPGERAHSVLAFRGDADRPFDPSNGSYFAFDMDGAEIYARNRAEATGAVPMVLKARLLVRKTLIDDDLVEWIGYDPEKIEGLVACGYDSVASASGSEIFVFSPERIEVIGEEPVAGAKYGPR